MPPYLGNLTEDQTIHFMWSSYGADGASITRATNGTVSVYKANGTTQSTAGVTDTEDFDSLTGIHLCTIDTSADAFYAVANDYAVVLSAATIDGKTVNAVLALFSIENRFIEADVTKIAGAAVSTTTAQLGVNVVQISGDATAADNLEAATDGGTYNVGGGAVVAASVTGAVGSVTGAVGSVTGAVGSVTGNVGGSVASIASGGITTGSFASGAINAAAIADNAIGASELAADAVAEIADAVWDELSTGHTDAGKAGAQMWTDVDAILADTGTDGVVLANDAITAAKIASGAITSAKFAADAITASALAADAVTEIQSGLATAAAVDAVDNYVDTEVAAIKAVIDKLDTALELDGAVYRYTTNALEQSPAGSGGGLTAQQVRDAMKLAPTAGTPDAGSVDAHLDDILTDTGTTLDTLIKDIPTNAEFEARSLPSADYTVVSDLGTVQTGDAFARLGAPAGASISADIAAVKAQTAAIEAQTDDIGVAGAGLTAIPWNAAWDAEVQSEATDALNAYDPPTNAEMVARTLAAADYFDPAADTVANVTTVGSVTGAVGSVTGAVGSVTGAVGSVTGNVGGNVTGSVGSVAAGGITAASIATGAIDADALAADAVTEIQAGLATAAELAKVPKSDSNVSWNATALAAINAEVDTALNTAIPGSPTANSINQRIAAIDDLTQASGAGDLAAILTDTGTTLDTLIKDLPTVAEFEARTILAADYTVVSDLPSVPSAADIKTAIEADGSKLDHLWEMTEDDGGVRRLTTNALEQAPTGGSAPTAAAIRAEIDANSTQLAAILTDTGTTLPGTLATIAGYIDTEVAATLAAVDTEVAAIKAKTDTLPANPAGVGDLPTVPSAADNATAVAAAILATPANKLATDASGYISGITGTKTTLDSLSGADGDTLKDLSDEIAAIAVGAGLTAQEVRDAMKLAPTAGAPAAGSVDEHLDDILEDTGTTLPASIAALNNLSISQAQAAATAALNAYDPPTKAELDAADDAVLAVLTAIKGAGWTDETLVALDALLDAIKAKTDLVGTVNGLTSAAQADVRTAVGLAAADLDTQLSSAATAIGDVAAVLPSAAAGAAGGLPILGSNAADMTLNIAGNLVGTVNGLTSAAQADVRTAVGLAAANLDTQLSSAATAISGVTATVAISAAQAEQIAEGMIALAAYADFAQSITATTADNLATAEAFWFCVKARATDADADAVLLLSAADGLVTLAGATYATPANGTLTVFGTAGAWTVAATLTAQATALLTDYAGRHLVAEIKYRLASDAVRVLWSGVAAISRSVIHRTA